MVIGPVSSQAKGSHCEKSREDVSQTAFEVYPGSGRVSVFSFLFSTFLIAKASEMKAGWECRLGGGAVPPPCPAALRPRTPGCPPGTSSRGVTLV